MTSTTTTPPADDLVAVAKQSGAFTTLLTAAQAPASNGIIHVIDRVILPC